MEKNNKKRYEMISFLLIILFSVAAPHPSLAEREATIEQLRGRPVSVFDLGMLRLRLHFRHSGLGHVVFNQGLNRIDIYPPFDISVALDEENGGTNKKICSDWVEKIKQDAGILPNGRPAQDVSNYSWMFFQDRPGRIAHDDVRATEIDNLFFVNCGFMGDKTQLLLTSPLISGSGNLKSR